MQLHNKRVRRTTIKRSIHNIWSSCHVGVTYINAQGWRESPARKLLRYRRVEENMKRGITILLSLTVLATLGYFTVSKWAIRHETLMFHDASRNDRPVAVTFAIRRDKELQANAGMITLPVAVLNHGNTVKFTEYSFLANLFAARGYMAISIQHDLPTDPPMVTKVGELYVGRQPQYLSATSPTSDSLSRKWRRCSRTRTTSI